MIERHFLGWSRPCLELATDFLISRFENGKNLDLGSVLLVIPGRRAGRRLLDYLVTAAASRSTVLIPPQIVTVRGLIDKLITLESPLASEVDQRLLLARALLNVKPEIRDAIFTYSDIETSNYISPALIEQADSIATLFQEFTNACLDTDSIKNQTTNNFALFNSDKLQAIYEVRRHYISLLEKYNLSDINECLKDLSGSNKLQTQHIVLVSIIDLPRILDSALAKSTVDILIHAPETLANGFDKLGRVDIKFWTEFNLEISDENIFYYDNYQSLSSALAEATKEFLSTDPTKQQSIALGILDEAIIPEIQAQFSTYENLPHIHYSAGNKLSNSSIFKFILLIERFLSSSSFASFAELARHPIMEILYKSSDTENKDYLGILDNFQTNHLQHEISDQSLSCLSSNILIDNLYKYITETLRPIAEGNCYMLSEWFLKFADFLRNIISTNSNILDAFQKELEVAITSTIELVVNSSTSNSEKISSTEALSFFIKLLAEVEIHDQPSNNAIEALGQLELHLDDARILLVAPANEGYLPQSTPIDPFLPNSLRFSLGLPSFESRLANEKYQLAATIASRECVNFLVSKQNNHGESLRASRHLLLDNNVASRVLNFYNASSSISNNSEEESEKVVMLPYPTPITDSFIKVSTTSLKTYLTCPYLFYLKHILQIRPITDSQSEMDASTWGSLIHEVLAIYGRDSHTRNLSEQPAINNTLREILDGLSISKFGSTPLPAVKLQLRFLLDRLAHFSIVQAKRRREGFSIEHVELKVSDNNFHTPAPGDSSKPITLNASIDRIDINERTGERAILDYKTNDGSKFGPFLGHYKIKSQEWVDLQLPLYRFLAMKSLNLSEEPQIGYFWLGRSLTKTSVKPLDLSKELYENAIDTAFSITSNIGHEIFWPPTFDRWHRNEPLSILIDKEMVFTDDSLDLESGAEVEIEVEVL